MPESDRCDGATGGEFAIADVPDTYRKSDDVPGASQDSRPDRCYADKASAWADTKSRHGGHTLVDE